jgi:alkylhydroperoxidase/carboxymuconolactone decarboxylase family protein YurZ
MSDKRMNVLIVTNGVVFGDLWRRPDLTPPDRSLVTMAALAAMGDDNQLDFYCAERSRAV